MTWYYTGYRLKLAESVPGDYVIKPLASWKKSPPQPLSWGGWRQWVKVALKQAESLGKDVTCAFLGHLFTTLLLVGWEAPAPASAANECLATFQTSVWVFNFSSLPPFPRNSPTHRVSRAVSLLALLLFAQCLSCVKQHEKNITTGSKHLSCVAKQMKKQRRSRWGAVVRQSCDAHALGRQVGSCWGSGDPVSGCEAPKHEKNRSTAVGSALANQADGGLETTSCEGPNLFSLEKRWLPDSSFQYLWRGCQEDRAWLFTAVHGGSMRDDWHQLKQGKFKLFDCEGDQVVEQASLWGCEGSILESLQDKTG